MADENTTTPAEQAEETAPEAATETADAGATVRGTGGGSELDAETLRKLLKEAREEAAAYRVKAREATEKLAGFEGFVSPDEFSAAQARAAELEAELSKTRLAAKYDLPPNIAARISGSNDEEREADAKLLSEELETLGRSQVRVGRGGMEPSVEPTPMDPASLAARISRSRH